ncbi:hypothetical protein ACVKN2_000768 [Paenibacillus sp. PvR018]|nr:hypothetical protein [Paenibacillus sp. PvP091]MBP1168884.1 hypothetical protein [Paenibacillus sp. PvR098]MBP2439912.1 hypothetical protein [Paenibacillus sp. PvP052]
MTIVRREMFVSTKVIMLISYLMINEAGLLGYL